VKRALDRRIESAQAKARTARARVLATIGEVRHRLDPRTVARETIDAGFTQATRLVTETASAAKERPWLLALGATLFGLAVTVRNRMQSDGEDDNNQATNAAGES
jgi:ElaB/YqjD/DUF883 family membrane-anchored ribosome-binding protein